MDLYKVTIGEDVYLGTPEEVVRFMASADGAPVAEDLQTYMVGIAARIAERLDVSGVPTDDPQAFLEALQAAHVLRVEIQGAPSDQRSDPGEVLGDGPITFGDDVDLGDLDLGDA